MSSMMFGSPLLKDDPDSNKIQIILDELHTYSQNEIMKVKKNLDIIYGAYSEEKTNGINQIHEHLMNHITAFFDDVVLESNKDKQNIIKEIEDLLVEKDILEKELQMSIPIDDHNDATPLIDVQINIDKALKGCRKIKEERMKELKRLQDEEIKVCNVLGEQPKFAGIKSMPSATQLDTIKHHLVDLKNTQIKRRDIFVEHKAIVESLMESLEETAILSFDKLVLGNPSQFILSKSNLDELQKLIKRLEEQTENQKCVSMELRTKLSSLWDRLQIDVTYREQFVSNKKGFGKRVIQELKAEVERCETLKKENIKQFIENLRSELNDLWDKCHYGEHQRKECQIYYSPEYNEDVMDLLDLEVEAAKKFYNDNKEIYYLIEERDKLWTKMVMMQEQANDPARLWQNRGGQLLKEEKERKLIQKELPKVDKQLRGLIQFYEQKNGCNFLYKDKRLLDIIETQWVEMKNTKKTPQYTKPKTQMFNKVQTPQALANNKRKIVTTSGSHASKITPRRELFSKNTNVATLVPLNSTKLNDINLTTNQPCMTFQRGSNDENVSVESYATFQEHLENPKQMLLSPTSKHILKESNARYTPRKPFAKTPVKGSKLPLPSTPKTPLRTTPGRAVNPRTVTKLTRTINNKLPIIF
ncbi:protein regulator of cytokinesis 1-like isoform X2 [Adelges cooleyi]|uniref:protein regulator of cytokinesis 1-like isoform X2 n=1 Tax=Adelges cooleyi TaxID=133065 RepID=UPI00217FC308|nr:protein regulator of cytokinesis 1-like isoform X2 [Adelges cooleyi]